MSNRLHRAGLCLIVVAAACGARDDATTDSSRSNDLADVSEFFAAKAAYGKEGMRRRATVDSSYYKEAVIELERRLRAIITPDSVSDAPLTANLGSLYDGDEDANALPGLIGRRDSGEVLVTTPELLSVWVRSWGDSVSSGPSALASEDMLTWAFQDDAHVYPFGDIKAHASLPPEVFLAWIIGEGQDNPGKPKDVLVGIDRGHHIYLVRAPMAAQLGAPASCGPAYGDEYHICFGKHVAEHANFSQLVEQARAVSKIPNK